MRILRSAAGLTFALLISATLGGCTPPVRHVIPTSEPSVKPVFKSDAEALAAAKKAYEGYNEASDAVGRAGGAHPEKIAPWVTASWLKSEIRGAAALVSSGQHLVGATRVKSIELQQVTSDGDRILVDAYVCLDLSKADLRNASDQKVTPVGRSTELPLQVEFTNKAPGSDLLVLSESKPWQGQSFC